MTTTTGDTPRLPHAEAGRAPARRRRLLRLSLDLTERAAARAAPAARRDPCAGVRDRTGTAAVNANGGETTGGAGRQHGRFSEAFTPCPF